MRKLYILAIAALSALGAFAQPKAGTISVIPKLGLNLSNLTNQDILYSSTNPEYQPTTIKSKFREGIVFGADVQYQRTDRFALSLGALYSKEGCRYSDISDSYKQNNIRYVSLTADQHIAVDYLNIPLVAHFYVADNLALNAGVQLGIALSAHHKETLTSFKEHEDETIEYDKNQEGIELNHYKADYDLAKFMKNTTVSIPVGVSYEYSNIVIDARYNIPVTKAGKAETYSNTKNKTFQFTVGYKFNL